MTTKRARFETYKGRDGWRWRLIARNGKIVAVGEAYTREASAKRSLRAVEAAAREAFGRVTAEGAKLVPIPDVSAILRARLEAADHG